MKPINSVDSILGAGVSSFLEGSLHPRKLHISIVAAFPLLPSLLPCVLLLVSPLFLLTRLCLSSFTSPCTRYQRRCVSVASLSFFPSPLSTSSCRYASVSLCPPVWSGISSAGMWDWNEGGCGDGLFNSFNCSVTVTLSHPYRCVPVGCYTVTRVCLCPRVWSGIPMMVVHPHCPLTPSYSISATLSSALCYSTAAQFLHLRFAT